ncbi:MAG: multicopper oxidase domain-containing protein [Bryobacteraceae bacterium]
MACSFPPEVDETEEGTPPVPPHGRRRYQFVAKPAGSRWYHSHAAAMLDLHRGAYTGQFGSLMIDSANDPGLYDQEVFLALREWEPYLTTMDQDEASRGFVRPQFSGDRTRRQYRARASAC